MDILPDKTELLYWLTHYGAIAIFVLLALGIIALPVPDETIMVMSGILMFKGKLCVHTTLIAAYAGSMFGITVSYLLGMLGDKLILHRYGKWFGLTEERFRKVHNWFEKYGKWTLTLGYFVPGVRHFTGLVAGMTELRYKHFAIFAYTGALLWVTTFISLGYFLGDYWLRISSNLHLSPYSIAGSIAAVILASICLRLWLNRQPKNK